VRSAVLSALFFEIQYLWDVKQSHWVHKTVPYIAKHITWSRNYSPSKHWCALLKHTILVTWHTIQVMRCTIQVTSLPYDTHLNTKDRSIFKHTKQFKYVTAVSSSDTKLPTDYRLAHSVCALTVALYRHYLSLHGDELPCCTVDNGRTCFSNRAQKEIFGPNRQKFKKRVEKSGFRGS
jgi:hypothetical protein